MKHTPGKTWQINNEKELHSARIVHLIGDYFFYTHKETLKINGKDLLVIDPKVKISFKITNFTTDDAPKEVLFYYQLSTNTTYFSIKINTGSDDYLPMSDVLIFSSLSEMLKAQKILLLTQFDFSNIPSDTFLI